MDQLVATVKSLQVELTDMEEKHKTKSKQANDLQAMLDMLTTEHDKCLAIVAEEPTEVQTQPPARVKLGASALAKSGRVQFGAGLPTGGLTLPMPMPAASSTDDADKDALIEELKRELEMQLNKLHGAQGFISSLTKQMEEARRAAEASEETTEQLEKEVERLLRKEVERLRGEIAGVEDMKRQQAQGFETQRIEPCALFSSVSISSLTKQVDRLRRGKEEAEIAVNEVHQKPENAQASADERCDGVQQLQNVLKQEIEEGRPSLAEQVAELERILTMTKEQLEDHRHSHAKSLADKEAEMATMRMQLAEADQRHSGMFDLVVKAHRLLNGECSVCD
jgi:uncharacterized phage infection (PIP) family protein YhgE